MYNANKAYYIYMVLIYLQNYYLVIVIYSFLSICKNCSHLCFIFLFTLTILLECSSKLLWVQCLKCIFFDFEDLTFYGKLI